MHADIDRISVSDAPTITFKFAGDTVSADLDDARLYGEMRGDGGCDLRLTTTGPTVLANIVVHEHNNRGITESVMDVGSALMWSHWRWMQARTNGVEGAS